MILATPGIVGAVPSEVSGVVNDFVNGGCDVTGTTYIVYLLRYPAWR